MKYGALGRFKRKRKEKFFCNGCHHYKTPQEFFTSKNPCGLSNRCKLCVKNATVKWRKKNRKKVIEQVLRHRKKYPEKYEARRLVKNALKNGSLLRKPCNICFSSNSQAHHPDYSKPLEVTWLCPLHHAEKHRGTPRTIYGKHMDFLHQFQNIDFIHKENGDLTFAGCLRK